MNDLYEVNDYDAAFLWSEVCRVNRTGGKGLPRGALIWFKGSSEPLFVPHSYVSVLGVWKSRIGMKEGE